MRAAILEGTIREYAGAFLSHYPPAE
jgi:hypothetical protein